MKRQDTVAESSISVSVAHGRRVVNRIWRSPFARNVVVVASGTAGAQAITIAFAPLITRIYGPEAFGLLGTFMAIVAVVIPIAALAYPTAIVLPKTEGESLGLVRLSAILSLAVALVAAIVLWVGGGWLTAALGVESVAGYLFLIPAAMLFAAWLEIAQQWLIRTKGFDVIARAAVTHALIINSAKAAIGWLHPVAALLIVLGTLGYALHAILLFIGARRRYRRSNSKPTEGTASSMVELASRHRDFPLYRAPQNFINAASQSLPVLMLAAFFGPVAAGFYALARMVVGMPSTLVGKAVNDVFYPRITEAAHNGENLPQHILRATGALFVIGILPFGLVALSGPWLFSLVFGAEWAMAGEYARWLAIFALFNFINRPCVAAVPVLGIQRGLLFYEFFSTAGKVAGLFVGFYWFSSDIWAIAFFSLIGVIAYVVMILWILACASGWRDNEKTG